MANEATNTILFTAAPAPHWHCGRTIRQMMVEHTLALAPAIIMAAIVYGVPALRVIALAGAAAVVTEAICLKIMDREITIDDFSALYTGMLFGFLLPGSVPWWLVIVGAALTMFMGRMIFGGLGGNPVSAPLIGWAILKVSWPAHMNVHASMLDLQLADPVSQLNYFGLQNVNVGYMDMLLGQVLGGVGAVQVLGILLGGAFLLYRGYLKPYIPGAFILGVLLLGGLFWTIDSSQYASPIFHLLAGSTLFGALFLAPDPSSSPVGLLPMLLYGFLGGALVVILRTYGIYPDAVPFAILLVNLFFPLFDLIRPKPFGAK